MAESNSPAWVKVALLVGGLVLAVPCCIGGIAAIAIPPFIDYTRRSKAVEAEANIEAMRTLVRAAIERDGQLPVSIEATPSLGGLGASTRPWPEASGWVALGFDPGAEVRYAYELRCAEASCTGIAYGDLDEDGRQSEYTFTCLLAAHGDVSAECGEIERRDPLE